MTAVSRVLYYFTSECIRGPGERLPENFSLGLHKFRGWHWRQLGLVQTPYLSWLSRNRYLATYLAISLVSFRLSVFLPVCPNLSAQIFKFTDQRAASDASSVRFVPSVRRPIDWFYSVADPGFGRGFVGVEGDHNFDVQFQSMCM